MPTNTKYDDTNRGVLFKKEDRISDKSPEYEGRLNVNGKEYRLAAWVKESTRNGKKFFSISVSDPKGKVVPEGREPEFPKPELPKIDVSDIPDQIPF